LTTSPSSPYELLHVLQQLGPATPEISYLIQHQPDQWELGMDHDVVVRLQWQTSPPGLMLSLPLGAAPDTDSPAVYARMLGAHLQRRATSQARVALSAAGELLVLSEITPLPGSLQQLQLQLASFIADASVLLQHASHDAAPSTVASGDNAGACLVSQRA